MVFVIKHQFIICIDSMLHPNNRMYCTKCIVHSIWSNRIEQHSFQINDFRILCFIIKSRAFDRLNIYRNSKNMKKHFWSEILDATFNQLL